MLDFIKNASRLVVWSSSPALPVFFDRSICSKPEDIAFGWTL